MFKINLFKSIGYLFVWLCFAAALFFYYYHTTTKQITGDLSSAYIQSGIKVIKDLLDLNDLKLIDAYQKKDKAFLNKRINAVYKLMDRVEFAAILDRVGNVITHRDFSLPIIRKKIHVTKEKPHIIFEIAWSRRYDRIIVILSSDDSWQKLAKIYLAIPSGISNPLNDYLFLTTALGLLLILLSIVRLKLISGTDNGYETPYVKPDTPPIPVDKLPRPFGNYTLIEEIGAGGMATLYKAYKHNRESKFYAVKIPHYKDLAPEDQDDLYLLFDREVEIAKEFKHANVFYVYEATSQGSDKALVMEYIDGRDLGQIISELKQNNEKLTLNLLVYIATKICAGLEYCHSKNKIHRDIKPGNIMVSFGGSVKIGDFGIAKEISYANPDHTIVGTLGKGTPLFASPEQLAGEGADQLSDIYSLGLTLYYAFTGKPINEINPVNDNTKTKQITPLAKITPGTPSDLNAIIMKCVQKQRGKRYQNVQALGEDLVNLKFGLSIASDEIKLASDLAKLMRRLFP
ncbi:serine/threonine-protein kinase [Desulfococcaceae bacterium HSG7]|nr:serine/threonine-protein kinase [Desulfococcaceae bacterium HSG7]